MSSVSSMSSVISTGGTGRTELIDQCRRHLHRFPAVRHVLQPAHGRGETRADAKRALGLPQQKQAAVRGLAAALEIDCELLALNSCKIKGKQRNFGHGGVALGLGCEALVWQRIATPSQQPPPH